MANTWNRNPLENERPDSIYAITDTASVANTNTMTPNILSSFVVSQSASKLPPYEFKPQEIKSRAKFLALDVFLKRTLFTTNSPIEGQLQLQVPKDGACKIGKIAIHLLGIEETLPQGKVKGSARLFLAKKLTVQDIDLAPTDAVFASKPDELGMWKAKKGLNTIDFNIPLQRKVDEEDDNIKTEVTVAGPLPGSYWSKKYGGLRYVIAWYFLLI